MLSLLFSQYRRFSASAFLVAVLLTMPSLAVAGFQWVAPSTEASLPSSQPYSSKAPEPPPVIIQAPLPSTPVTRAPQTPESQTLRLPSTPKTTGGEATASGNSDQEKYTLTAPNLNREKIVAQDKPLQGFANNVPLAVALRQILPPEYGFSVAQNVKLNTLVSWQGGKPWKQTLEEMLSTVGLSSREQGKIIHIVTSSEKSAPTAGVLIPPKEGSSLAQLDRKEEGKPLSLVQPTKPAIETLGTPLHQGQAVDTWTANRGDTLHKVLEDWCRRANVELSWQAEYDYPFQASVTLTGNFEEAVRNLLSGFQDAKPQPIATLHSNQSAGQTILVVQTRGNNYND